MKELSDDIILGGLLGLPEEPGVLLRSQSSHHPLNMLLVSLFFILENNPLRFHSGNFGNGFSAWLYEDYLDLFTRASDSFGLIRWDFSDVNFHKDWKLYTFTFLYQSKNGISI